MSEEAELVVKGRNGIVYAYNDRVEISRKSAVGFLTQGVKANRVIHYRDMTAIETKVPNLLTNGYMQFIINPELSIKQRVSVISGTTTESMKDPNAVIFTAMKKKNVSEFKKLTTFVLARLEYYKNDNSNTDNDLNDLKQLKSLLDDGIITQEDFDAQKKQILGI